jgi:methylmalonyl-CoA mutase cobalamin-binding domain/chain
MNANKTSIEQLLKAMIATDREAAGVLIEGIIQQGMPPEQVITDILGPVLVRIGVLWGKESVSLAQTFVAAKIAEDVLLRCMPEVGATSPHKSPVVIGNIEDDFHSLGRRSVATFLRAAGWEVYDLGNDITAEEFVDKAIEVNASVVGVSAMMQTTALNIRKVRELIDARGLQHRLKLAVGGAVFNWRPEFVAEVGADGTAENAAEVDALLRRLQSEVKAGAPS